MADTKISALSAATTPLAGTEVLPIVQGSTTKKVSIADLTIGRDVTVKTLTISGTNPRVNYVPTTPFTGYCLTDYSSGAGSFYVGTDDSTGSALGTSAYARLLWGIGNYPMIFGINNTEKFRIDTSSNFVPKVAGAGINFSANTPAAGKTSQLLNWYEEGTWTPTSFDITYAAATGSYTRIGRQVFVHFSVTLPTTIDANNITIVGFPFTVANSDAMRSGAIGYTDYATACTASPVKNATRGNIFTFGGTPVTNVAASGKTFAGVFIYNV